MTRTILTVPAVAVVLLAAAACASVETGPPRDVAGRWTGQCTDCPVRAFTLVLVQDGGRLRGTLQASGRTGLGESEMVLREGRIAGRAVTFHAVGADGIPLHANLRVSADGRTLTGQGRHRAAFALTFTRDGR